MHKYFVKLILFYFISFCFFAFIVNLYSHHYEYNMPSFYKWVPHGSTVWIKPRYGRQVMPDRKFEKLDVNKKFLFSNSPESLTHEVLPVYLYRSETPGDFRLMLHHQNMLGFSTNISVYFINTSEEYVYLTNVRSSTINIHDDSSVYVSSETMSLDPAIAGRNAFIKWLMPKNFEGRVCIAPGSFFELTLPFDNMNTLTFMNDFLVTDEDGIKTDITVVVTVEKDDKLNDESTSELLSTPLVVDSLADPSLHTRIQRVRGFFDYTFLKANFSYKLSDISYSEISSAVDGIYSSYNPGEYSDSIAKPDLYVQKDAGNFGITYMLNFYIINDLDKDEPVILLASMAGGRGIVVLKEIENTVDENKAAYDEGKIIFPHEVMVSVEGAHRAWIFENEKIEKDSYLSKSYIFSLPGGCNGPVRFYAVPLSRLGDILLK